MTADVKNLVEAVVGLTSLLHDKKEIRNQCVTAQTAMRLLKCKKDKLSKLTRLYDLKDETSKTRYRYKFNKLISLIPKSSI